MVKAANSSMQYRRISQKVGTKKEREKAAPPREPRNDENISDQRIDSYSNRCDIWEDMLIITGTGRCGTSCLAKFCQLIGCEAGEGWNEYTNAGCEEGVASKINDKLIRNPTEDDIQTIKEFKQQVIKDPRFTIDDIADSWIDARKDLKFLFLYRDVEKVVDSLYASIVFFGPHIKSYGVDLKGNDKDRKKIANILSKKVSKFLLNLLKRDVPFRTLTFPNFLTQYDKVYNILTGFGELVFEYEDGKQKWMEWMDKRKVHHGIPDPLSGGQILL